ncbi:uncharacterized protein PAC_18664 [Phialocephala subalpina]|uniref:Uncharacterized protein n=1 Tax=Phialocephala subalpina TaxID=576137 RepID=A0A1L7XUS5_9HELO|nr:uncharacterized protein PAC_18664 [Phialocephala subalpina]
MSKMHEATNDGDELNIKPETHVSTDTEHPDTLFGTVIGEGEPSVGATGVEELEGVRDVKEGGEGKGVEGLNDGPGLEREEKLDGGQGSTSTHTTTSVNLISSKDAPNSPEREEVGETIHSNDEVDKVLVDDSPAEPESHAYQSQDHDQGGEVESGKEFEKAEESKGGEESKEVDGDVKAEGKSEQDGDQSTTSTYQKPTVETQPPTPEKPKDHDEPQGRNNGVESDSSTNNLKPDFKSTHQAVPKAIEPFNDDESEEERLTFRALRKKVSLPEGPRSKKVTILMRCRSVEEPTETNEGTDKVSNAPSSTTAEKTEDVSEIDQLRHDGVEVVGREILPSDNSVQEDPFDSGCIELLLTQGHPALNVNQSNDEGIGKEKKSDKLTNNSNNDASTIHDVKTETLITAAHVLVTSTQDQPAPEESGNTAVTSQEHEVIEPFDPPPSLPSNMDNLPLVLDAWMRDIDSYLRTAHENLEKLRKKCQRCNCNDTVAEPAPETCSVGDATGVQGADPKPGWDTTEGTASATQGDNWGQAASWGDTDRYEGVPEPRTSAEEEEQERIALEESRRLAMEEEQKLQTDLQRKEDEGELRCLECPRHCPPRGDDAPRDKPKPGLDESNSRTPDPDMNQKRLERFTPKPLSPRTIAKRKALEMQGKVNKLGSRNRLGNSARPPADTTPTNNMPVTEQPSLANYVDQHATHADTQVALHCSDADPRFQQALVESIADSKKKEQEEFERALAESQPNSYEGIAAETAAEDETSSKPTEVIEQKEDDDLPELVAVEQETRAADSTLETPPSQSAEGQGTREAKRRAREVDIAGWRKYVLDHDDVPAEVMREELQKRKVPDDVIDEALRVLGRGG